MWKLYCDYIFILMISKLMYISRATVFLNAQFFSCFKKILLSWVRIDLQRSHGDTIPLPLLLMGIRPVAYSPYSEHQSRHVHPATLTRARSPKLHSTSYACPATHTHLNRTTCHHWRITHTRHVSPLPPFKGMEYFFISPLLNLCTHFFLIIRGNIHASTR